VRLDSTRPRRLAHSGLEVLSARDVPACQQRPARIGPLLLIALVLGGRGPPAVPGRPGQPRCLLFAGGPDAAGRLHGQQRLGWPRVGLGNWLPFSGAFWGFQALPGRSAGPPPGWRSGYWLATVAGDPHGLGQALLGRDGAGPFQSTSVGLIIWHLKAGRQPHGSAGRACSITANIRPVGPAGPRPGHSPWQALHAGPATVWPRRLAALAVGGGGGPQGGGGLPVAALGAQRSRAMPGGPWLWWADRGRVQPTAVAAAPFCCYC